MSEVDRQVRQEPLNVLAFAVPGDEANDGECMAEVMQSRLKSGILERDTPASSRSRLKTSSAV